MKNQMMSMMVCVSVYSLTPAFAMDGENEMDKPSTASVRQTRLEASPLYDWSTHFKINIAPRWEPGNQVLHTKSTNKPYTTNLDAKKFVKKYMKVATRLISDADVLKFGVEAAAQTTGYFLEMGVGMGRTVNFIAALNSTKTIYGFDSFEGLPEDWDKGNGIIPQGTFALRDSGFSPPVLNNVTVYKGLFANTLPLFRDEILKQDPIAFLHIDCDSYTPTKDVFEALGQNIKPGTVIVFDELYNYPNYAQHEWRALQKFLKPTNYELEFLAFNIYHEQVAVRVK